MIREIFVVLKKEFKNFIVRKAMIKWYVLILVINILFTFMERWDGIPITYNVSRFSLIMMIFSVFLVPNTLSLDVVGGEKFHRTLETMISTPLSVRALMLGKTLFILSFALFSLFAITIEDTIALSLRVSMNFFDAGYSLKELTILYFIVINAVLIIIIIGTVSSLIFKNLKINGYLVTLVNVAIMYVIFTNLEKNNKDSLAYEAVAFAIITLVLLAFSVLKLTKARILKCLK